MIDAAAQRLHRAYDAAARATMIPLLVRAAIFLCGLLGVVVAMPAQFLGSRLLGVLVVVAAAPALAPRGRAAMVLAVLLVAGWVADTTWYEQPVALWRLLALATVLYLGHSLTALAAVLPYDAVVRVDVVAHWLAVAFAVVLGSAVLAVVVFALAGAGGGGYLAATLVGLAAAVAAARLLTVLARTS